MKPTVAGDKSVKPMHHALHRWVAINTALILALSLGPASTSRAADAAEKKIIPPHGDRPTAIHRGIKFLLENQNKNGSWGSARRTKDLNIWASAPGSHAAFRSATTALCVESLIATGATKTNASAAKALTQGEEWLLENLPSLRRADSLLIYNVWGHAFGIQALAAMHRRAADNAQRQARIIEVIRGQIDLLGRYESVDGGWGYYDFRAGAKKPSSDSIGFVTATVLVAFDRARDIGVEIPEKLVKRGFDSINRQKKEDHSYLYGEYLQWQPMRGINRPAGSLGRSQACNYALRTWGEKSVTDDVYVTWLDRLYHRNGWLSIGRKRPVPHEAWFQVAAYFYYYGHYYASLCILDLPPAKRARHIAQLDELLLPLQEKDGSWWDFPFYDYHQPYGTAFALLTMANITAAAAK